ncbi:MAG: hypothetical protein IAE86_19880 [Burkholderiaceae bacterium]|nr:hypothetical protein [Burkholderiaceae bacterium]
MQPLPDSDDKHELYAPQKPAVRCIGKWTARKPCEVDVQAAAARLGLAD